ncbi:hypothetical protein FDP41_002176 [Naegleria fowleri]|uniref:ethanolamine kinase n=1 Tax=Naegleria fowleri TaxID=5763 RepID=A0A6A5BV22_NAEFO|nr:uncharacterized protein FDP41_002176 [Naegleria fowleri]KAF0979106.1 hypothetical protein FDP41_002176 [Naegleria fowleri]CAG4718077.1 unnamed protein product [Naegleria fowleri]
MAAKHFPEIFFDLHMSEDELVSMIEERFKTVFFENVSEPLKLKRLTGGITNRIYKVDFNGKQVLCRINGLSTEKIIDRDVELFHMQEMYKHGQGPQVHCVFKNGYIYDFIVGECTSTAELMADKCEKIAEKLAMWHKMNIEKESREPVLWKLINKWVENAKGFEWSDKDKREKFSQLNFEKIVEQCEFLQNKIFNVKEKQLVDPKDLNSVLDLFSVGFCHNDLLALNVLYNDQDDSVHFIDYEYCGYSYRAFDIGNHFDEYAGFDLKKNDYPNHEIQTKFVRKYLQTVYEGPSSNISNEMVEKYRKGIHLFACISHIYWGVWAINQAKFSDIDFDYLSYAKGRFEWYFEEIGNVDFDNL